MSLFKLQKSKIIFTLQTDTRILKKRIEVTHFIFYGTDKITYLIWVEKFTPINRFGSNRDIKQRWILEFYRFRTSSK